MNFPTASCSARSRAVSIVSGSSTTNTPSHHLPLNFPLAGFQNREFRVGYDLTTDVQKAYRPQCRLWRNPPGIPPHRIWWVAAVISGFVQPHLAATLHREGNSEASGDVRSVCPGLAASVGGPCRILRRQHPQPTQAPSLCPGVARFFAWCEQRGLTLGVPGGGFLSQARLPRICPGSTIRQITSVCS